MIFQKIKNHLSELFNNLISSKKDSKELDLETEPTPQKTLEPFVVYEKVYHPTCQHNSWNLTEEGISQVIDELFLGKNLINEDKYKVLLNIYSDCLAIHSALIPLVKIGFTYSLDIVGGSIRDFILNKHNEIKDLDILLELLPANWASDHLAFNIKSRLLTREHLLDKTTNYWATKEELDKVNFLDNESFSIRKQKLVQVCFNRIYEMDHKKIFSKEERFLGTTNYGDDLLHDLSAVFSFKSPTFNYPIEVLITDTSRQEFFNNIDFNICNIGLQIVENEMNLVSASRPQLIQFKDLLTHFFMDGLFPSDVKNKILTFSSPTNNHHQLQYSLGDHLPRLQKKYPDYQFEMANKNISSETQKVIDSIILQKTLDDTLPSKESKQTIKRSKI